MFNDLKHLLTHANARFVCVAAGDHVTNSKRFTTPIDHEASPPLDDCSLSELAQIVGDQPEVTAFYRQWGSLRLFRGLHELPSIGRASAYYIAPPTAWPEIRESVEDWWSHLGEEELQEFLPEWISNYAAIGEIPNSGNYFLMPLEGADRGKIFEFEHDGFEFIERGATFESFVNSLADTGASHLEQISGHTRYSDGQTASQWMPERYLHGADA